METKQFTELLKMPLGLEHLPLEALRELVARYPFSPSLQMLLLKQYQLCEHPAYDEQLARAAIYAPDRRALYHLMQLKAQPKAWEPAVFSYKPEVEELPTKMPTAIEAIEPEHEYNMPVRPIEETFDAVTFENPTVEYNTKAVAFTDEVIVEENNTGVLPENTAVEQPYSNTTVDEPALDETEVIQPSMLEIPAVVPVLGFPIIPFEHLGEAAHDAPVVVDIPAIDNELTKASTTEIVVAEQTDADGKDMAVAEEPSLPTVEVTAPVEAIERTDNLPNTDSFMGWLQRFKQGDAFKSQQTNIATGLQHNAAHDDEEKAALDALFGAGSYEATLIKASADMPSPISAIEVAAPPTREELLEPDDEANRRMDAQAKKSLSMGQELVTETLAKIYEIQKKYAKAIEAYEVLKVRFPDKAAQYDAKIEKLKEA